MKDSYRGRRRTRMFSLQVGRYRKELACQISCSPLLGEVGERAESSRECYSLEPKKCESVEWRFALAVIQTWRDEGECP